MTTEILIVKWILDSENDNAMEDHQYYNIVTKIHYHDKIT